MDRRFFFGLAMIANLLLVFAACAAETKLNDPQNRFEITLFAEAPQIVTPIGAAVDKQHRVYAIESHTHFRPKDYVGPKTDRILRLQDTDHDGRADKTVIFAEGFTHAMDIALSPDGDLYVATRSAIHRLRDKNDDGQADENVTIVRLDTKGDYPHNGLSGLAFDGNGKLYFGLGENLGAAYKLIGSDDSTLAGEAEGGSVYRCGVDGSKLHRFATGFWNPFGMCFNGGELFATDNDPDGCPPCRLLHVIDGGDYGYEYRYGRGTLHPFQSWDGELPGTLPMVSGTGEAPCEIISYDGGLLVASWGDNRLEHYQLQSVNHDSYSYRAQQTTMVSGDLTFRPVGIAATSDGTLYVTDWASASYALNGKGRIWKLKPRKEGQLHTGLVTTVIGLDPLGPDESNPFVRSKAITKLSKNKDLKAETIFDKKLSSINRENAFLALRRSNYPNDLQSRVPDLLKHDDPTIRFLTLKLIADQRLKEFRPLIEAGLESKDLTRELLAAHITALEMIDIGRIVHGRPDPKALLKTLTNDSMPARVRALALRLLPADTKELNPELLGKLIAQPDEELRLEAVRTMALVPNNERFKMLASVAKDAAQPPKLRAEAAVGLAGASDHMSILLAMATGDDKALRDDALRSLVDLSLNEQQKQSLSKLTDLPEAARLLGVKSSGLPPRDNVAAWMERTAGEGDAEAGRRIFFHAKVGYCARCHTYEGRGGLVGPDLTRIHERATREWLLTAILQPSRDVAPAFRQWQIETKSGKVHTGVSLRKGSGTEDYLAADGKPFSVRLGDIEARHELSASIMPEGAVDQLTAGELRDLLAFLLQKR